MRKIADTFKTEYVLRHIPSVAVKTPEEVIDAREIAETMREYINAHNGQFQGKFCTAYAIHAAQLWHKFTSKLTDKPYNFFVVNKDITTVEWGKQIQEEDRSIRDITNIIFPEQIIINPEIVTATQTFMDDVKRKDGSYAKKAIGNVMRYPEACMSYNEQWQKETKQSRFYRIKVRYQIFDDSEPTGLKTIEEWCQGLKSHIFQHELDHSAGLSIVQKKHNPYWPTIEERERENGYTRKEVEEYTAKVLGEVEEKIQKNGVCLLMSIANGGYYRAETTLTELPEGFVEPDDYSAYNWQDGTILPPYDTAPWYTDKTAIMSEEELQALETEDAV